MKRLIFVFCLLALCAGSVAAQGVTYVAGAVKALSAVPSTCKPNSLGARNGTLYLGKDDSSCAALTATGAGGTVTSVSVTTANGVSGSVATATTTPAITLTLGAITP